MKTAKDAAINLAINPPKRKSSGPRPHLKTAGAPYRWKPGRSANPGGRPKSSSLTKMLKRGLELPVVDAETGRELGLTVAEAIVQNVMTRALDEVTGRPDTELIFDRLEGPVSKAGGLDGLRGVKEVALKIVFDDVPAEKPDGKILDV